MHMLSSRVEDIFGEIQPAFRELYSSFPIDVA